MRVIHKVISYLKYHPGLVLLIILLSIISIQTIKPGFYLLGWDNYSSYFHQPANLFRTFFSAWREHRGLGVQSDSEVVDIFRQVFFSLSRPFIPLELPEQIYYLLAFSMGGVLMYWLIWALLTRIKDTKESFIIDVASFVGALFYLCNLNTLGTFYFPIVTYITRFYGLPVIFLVIYFLFNKQVSITRYVLLFVLLLITTGSYITGTLFITTLIALLFFSMFQGSFKRKMLIVLFFISTNLFWLAPFASYTITKSSIIPLAPTFIGANETQLNKPKEYFSLNRQLSLYPTFFESSFKQLGSGSEYPFHPLARLYNLNYYKSIILLFPLFYIVGSVLILLHYKKFRNLLWAPLVIVFYIFLSLNEYSPVGFIYTWLSKYIPYFEVLFRFGDTKFHPYIAFSGSIASAVVVLSLLKFVTRIVRRRVVYPLLIMITGLIFYVFRFYFNGNLIGFFMYNKIPDAYFTIASAINKYPANERVLHLPFDSGAYWRSYVWGAVGSSFFHYLIDKQYIDKTFEPASMENAYLHKELARLLDNIQYIEDTNLLRDRVNKFYTVLKTTGIGYVLLDESISSEITTRGITLWGKFNYSDAKLMTDQLKKYGYAETLTLNSIDIEKYRSIYKSPYDKVMGTLNQEKAIKPLSIELFKIKDSLPILSFVPSAIPIDPELSDGFPVVGDNLFEDTIIQDKHLSQSVFLPFQRRDSQITNTLHSLQLNFQKPTLRNGTYSLYSPQNSSEHQLAITVRKDDKNIYFSLYNRPYPIINGHEYLQFLKEIEVPIKLVLKSYYSNTIQSAYLANWQILDSPTFSKLRLSIGDIIVPVPIDISLKEQYIADIMVTGENIPFDVLDFTKEQSLQAREFTLTQDPNCYKDKLENYLYTFDTSKNINITSQNGSTCFLRSLDDQIGSEYSHAELKMRISGKQEDLENPLSTLDKNISKPRLKKAIMGMPKPNQLRICLQQSGVDECLNTHTVLQIGESQDVVVPFERSIAKRPNLVVLFALTNLAYQKQTIEVSNILLDLYKPVVKTQIQIHNDPLIDNNLKLDAEERLTVELPKTLSPYAYYHNNLSGFTVSNKPCETSGFRTYRQLTTGILSYVENCSNEVSTLLPFQAKNFLFWSTSYNLLSGQYPQFILRDDFNEYVNEHLSLYQGYPKIPGFKLFQSPESVNRFQTLFDPLGIINKLQISHAYTFVDPAPEVHDRRPKQFTIHENSGNDGIMLVEKMDIVPMPSQWKNFMIKPMDNIVPFAQPSKYTFSRIIPSLWQVDITSDRQNTLLRFNQGYDSKWRVYNSVLGIINPFAKGIQPTRCEGFANCFALDSLANSKNQMIYVFYTPERLSFLGWFATIFSGIAFWYILRKR